MKYAVIILLLAGAAFATFVPGMYPCPYDRETAYRHEACTYDRNTIICSFSHTHRGAKGPSEHKFSIQFPYGTPTEE
jgi:hypothetical protein